MEKWRDSRSEYGTGWLADSYNESDVVFVFNNGRSCVILALAYFLGRFARVVYNEKFSTLTFPLVRRVWPSLVANDIVSVQPMTAPGSALFYTDSRASDWAAAA